MTSEHHDLGADDLVVEPLEQMGDEALEALAVECDQRALMAVQGALSHPAGETTLAADAINRAANYFASAEGVRKLKSVAADAAE